MRCRFAFNQTGDGRLLVTMEALWGFPPTRNGQFVLRAYDDENTFIQNVVLAELSSDDSVELIAGVLLAIAERGRSSQWVSVTLNEQQIRTLEIAWPSEEREVVEKPDFPGFQRHHLAQAVLKSPTPVCMMTGPQHVITFINPAFLELLGRSADDVKDKPVRQGLSDLEGQPFFALLDRVYSSGEPFIGVEMPAQVFHKRLGAPRERYFDFVYEPVRYEAGAVCGILCQANDVTERVLEKHVRESREEQLYRQWAELEAIYSESPLGMCLIDAKTLRILRLNKMKAKLLGRTVDEVIGRRIGEISYTQYVELAYRSVIASRQATSFSVDIPFGGDQNDRRPYLWNLNPVFSATGEVEAIASTVMDISTWPRSLKETLESQEAEAFIQSGEA